MKLTSQNYDDLMSINHLTGILLNVTNQCNLRCDYCFTTQNPKVMSIDTAKKGILWGIEKKCSDVEKLQVCWFGGEPMLEFESVMIPVMEWARNEGLPVSWSMTSNLTLLTDERIQKLEEFNVGILCSVDGPEMMQDCHRKTCGGNGSWNLIKDSLRKMGQYKNCTGFRTTITPENCETLFEAYKLAVDLGAPMWFGGPDICNIGWTKDKIDKMEQELFYISMNYFDLLFKYNCQGFSLPQIDREVKNIIGESGKKLSMENYCEIGVNEFLRCGLGTTSIGITPDGKLVSCQEHSTYLQDDIFFIGDLDSGISKEKHLRILNKYDEDRRNFFNKIVNSEKCKNCSIRESCGYNGFGCPSISFGHDSNLVSINDFYCAFTLSINAVSKAFLLRASMEGVNLSDYIKMLYEGRCEL